MGEWTGTLEGMDLRLIWNFRNYRYIVIKMKVVYDITKDKFLKYEMIKSEG